MSIFPCEAIGNKNVMMMFYVCWLPCMWYIAFRDFSSPCHQGTIPSVAHRTYQQTGARPGIVDNFDGDEWPVTGV